MGFFGSKKSGELSPEIKTPTTREQKNTTGTGLTFTGDASFLSPGMVLEGTLSGNVSICIEGFVKGKIKCDGNVFVGPKGKVEAEIECQTVSIQGEVIGNIKAVESITIEATGVLKGDIWTKSFTNQPGGFFEGYSHMQKKKASSKQLEDKKNK